MIVDYLKSIGCDGLASSDCGCGIDEIGLCDCINLDECLPARKKLCKTEPSPSGKCLICDEASTCWIFGDGYTHCYKQVKEPTEPPEGEK